MPEAVGGITLEKEILILKVGNKFNLCDRIIFELVQCGIHKARKISSILDIFPYEFIAESLSRLHNNGLVFINTNNGDVLLTSEVQRIIEQNHVQMVLSGQDVEADGTKQMMKNFSGTQKVIL